MSVLLHISHIPIVEQNFRTHSLHPLFPKFTCKRSIDKRVHGMCARLRRQFSQFL